METIQRELCIQGRLNGLRGQRARVNPHRPRSREAQKGQEQGTPESSFPAGGDAEPLPGTMLSEHTPPTKIAALAQLLQIIRNRES